MKVLKLEPQNLRELAGLNGFTSVEALAAHIGKHRVSLYNALYRPQGHVPIISALEKALPNRQVRSKKSTAVTPRRSGVGSRVRNGVAA
jgi:hypothetical protein